MNCPKCRNVMSYFKEEDKWFCRVCEKSVKTDKRVAPIEISQWDTKGIAVALGIISSIVAIAIVLINYELMFFWPYVGYFVVIWAGIIPIIGAMLVSANQFKIGGIIMIAGSVLIFPIGYIGIHGGIIALRLHKKHSLK